MSAAAPILESFSALSDPTRCRMLLLLDGHELTVSELGLALQLPQSTTSRHLKTLADAGWVGSRRDGTSRYYAIALDGAAGPRRQIWTLTRTELANRPHVDQDQRRLVEILARRSESSRQFFATSAAEWDRLREGLFGRHFAAQALIGLLPRTWTMADLGCGTGALCAALAPHVAHVTGVDASDEMLAAARTRLRSTQNVELRRGTLEALPIEANSVDAATMMLVLHHVASPADALSEAARVLKPGGRLLLVDMAPHEHEEYRQQMGHVWLGFSEEHIQRLLTGAGLTDVRVDPLPAAPQAKGPGLFAASAAKGGSDAATKS